MPLATKAAVSQSAKQAGLQGLQASTSEQKPTHASYVKAFQAQSASFQAQKAAVFAASNAPTNGLTPITHNGDDSEDEDEEYEGNIYHGYSSSWRGHESRKIKGKFDKMMSKASNTTEEESRQDQENQLNKIMGVVIILNALMMAAELDYGPDDGAPLHDKIPWIIMESIFILLFICELCVRVYWERWNWVKSWWNWLDFTVICIGVVESWIITFINSDGSELRMVTLLRIVRLVRLLRVAKLVRAYRKLYVTVMAFKDAVESILQILCIMLAGIFLCAIFTTSTIGRSDELRALQLANGTDGKDRFGTIPRSMYSLFELMTLEGWEQVWRPLVMAEPALGVFLLLFIMIFTFGLVNMIVAMVVEKTLYRTRQMETHEQKEIHEDIVGELVELYRNFTNGGLEEALTMEKFEAQLDNEESKIAQSLKKSGVPLNDPEKAFAIFDADLNGELTFQELLTGIDRIHSAAQSSVAYELLAIQATMNALMKDVKTIDKHLRGRKTQQSRASASFGVKKAGSLQSLQSRTDAGDGTDSAYSSSRSCKTKKQDLRNVANSRDETGQRDSFTSSMNRYDSTSSNQNQRPSLGPQPPPPVKDVIPPAYDHPTLFSSVSHEFTQHALNDCSIPGEICTSLDKKELTTPSVPTHRVDAVECLSLSTADSVSDFKIFAFSQMAFQEKILNMMEVESAARQQDLQLLMQRLDDSVAKQENIRERLASVENAVSNWIGESV